MTVPRSYYDHSKAGNMFIACSLTPLAIPITSTTAPKFVLWNKAGSGKNAVLVRYTAGWSDTTEAPGNILLAYVSPAGSALGTAAPMSVFTDTAVTNAKIGSGNVNTIRFAVAATLTAAGTVFYGMGLNHLTTTGAAITQTGWTYDHDFQETIIVPPGVAVYTCASAATVSKYNETLVWYEVPA